MTVSVSSRRRRRGIRTADVRRDAVQLLHLLGIDAELSVLLVGDAEMQRLNRTYRSKDAATDVLAFALREGEDGAVHADVLGDVVISLDTAARQAEARRVSPADEVRVLLAHGLLHLLGYDHERSRREARAMFGKQRRLLERLRRTVPLARKSR